MSGPGNNQKGGLEGRVTNVSTLSKGVGAGLDRVVNGLRSLAMRTERW
jgi:hypothetical protein